MQLNEIVPSVDCSLRVPAGVDTDSRLRVRGEGNAGRRGGPTGDLFVFISVKSDSGGWPSFPAVASVIHLRCIHTEQ